MQSQGSFGKRNLKRPSQGTPAPAPTPPANGDGTRLNAGFIATVAALVIAVGSGTFIFLNGGMAMPSFSLGFAKDEPAYVSSMDRTCGKGWRKDLPNVDQMHCYLTSNKRRLCDPKERAHLVATIGRYEDDYSVWSARHFAASMGSIAKANQNALEIGMETAKLDHAMDDPNVTDEELVQQTDKVSKIMGDVLEGPNKVLAEAQNDTPMYQLEDDLAELASAGLITEDDFGWSKPDWVKKGFQEVKSVKSTCAK